MNKIRRWLIKYYEHNFEYYQGKLERLAEVTEIRAKEVGYSYLNNIDEMMYLFDKHYVYLDLRNYYRTKCETLKAKMKYREII